MKKHLDLAFRFRKNNFTRCFMRNSEHKIIYAEKRVNNFLNNAKRKIILCRMLEIVHVKNSEQFYEKTMNSFT